MVLPKRNTSYLRRTTCSHTYWLVAFLATSAYFMIKLLTKMMSRSLDEIGTHTKLPLPVFLHIPKTGGTAIEGLLGFSEPQKEICTIFHTPIKWLSENAKKSNYGDQQVFTLMRHPYDRMLSQYNFMCWATREALHAVGYEYYDKSWADMKRCQRNTSQLNHFIHHHVEHLSYWGNDTRQSFDCHFLPQHHYTQDADRVLCNISEAKQFLEQHHGINVSSLHDLPSHDHGLLDDISIAILNQVYAGDFGSPCGYNYLELERNATNTNA